MIGVILCGGTGNRLWPLSRKNYSKQFLKLISNNSLLQDTYLRIKNIIGNDKVFIVGNKSSFFNILNQIKEVDGSFNKENILIEPNKMNTAPGMAIAVSYLKEKRKIDENEKIIFLPSDHFISDLCSFNKVINNINSLDESFNDKIITIGITPTRPETNYGYIKVSGKNELIKKVDAFKEKPNLVLAEKYYNSQFSESKKDCLDSGMSVYSTQERYYWNSGMYIFSIKTFFTEIEKYCNDMFSIVSKGYEYLLENFSNMPAISFDYAVSEKTDKIFVHIADFGWYDIGTFDGLSDALNDQKIKNNNLLEIDSKNVFSYSTNNKFIACVGVEDICVIENNDSILVQKKGRGDDVNKIIKYLQENNKEEINDNVIVYRPWGMYEVLLKTTGYKLKKVVMNIGGEMKMQSHKYRSEHYVVLDGVAEIIKENEKIILNKDKSVYISFNEKHKIKNIGKEKLVIVEIQVGEKVEEDDIIIYD